MAFQVRRNVALDRSIEIKTPAVVQERDRDRGQRFREGAETEARERRDRRPVLFVGPAEAFGPDDLAVDRYGHREARQSVACDHSAREPPGVLHGTGVPLGVRVDR